MRVTAVSLDEDGMPDAATVILTRKEMQLIAKLTGNLSYDSAEQTLLGHGEASSAVYSGLVGSVFNRYWDDGLNGAIRGDDE